MRKSEKRVTTICNVLRSHRWWKMTCLSVLISSFNSFTQQMSARRVFGLNMLFLRVWFQIYDNVSFKHIPVHILLQFNTNYIKFKI